MKASEREQALELRLTHQLGYGEIAQRLKVSKSTLSRWLADLPLSESRMKELRRNAWTRGEAKRERFRASMRARRETRQQQIYLEQKKKLSAVSKQSLYIAGLMLYAAEGDKKSRYEIAFSNTDPAMVGFFAWWLDVFLDIPRKRLKIQLHLYENMDIRSEELFWLKKLRFGKGQICKTQVKTVRKGGYSYREPFRHGTCKLYVGGGVKKAELMLSIKAFFDTYEGTQV